MTTLYDAILATAEVLTRVVDGIATDTGSKTTLKDTDRAQPDDWFYLDNPGIGGLIFFTSGSNDGVCKELSDWTNSTSLFSWVGDLAVATAADDTYKAAKALFAKDEYVAAINQALVDIGGVDKRYTNAAFITVADQMDYDLPTDVYDIKRVEVAGSTSTPYGYVEHNHWDEQEGKIRFRENTQPGTAGYLIRLTYREYPSSLTADTDTIDDLIHVDWVKWLAAVELMRQQVETGRVAVERYNEAVARVELMRRRYKSRVPQMQKDVKHSKWGRV